MKIRMKFRDKPGAIRGCATTRDLYTLERIGDIDVSQLGAPVAEYPSDDFIVAIDPETGHICIYEKQAAEAHRTTDSTTTLTQQLHAINERNRLNWERKS